MCVSASNRTAETDWLTTKEKKYKEFSVHRLYFSVEISIRCAKSMKIYIKEFIIYFSWTNSSKMVSLIQVPDIYKNRGK